MQRARAQSIARLGPSNVGHGLDDARVGLEGLTKIHGAAILVSEETRRRVGSGFTFAPSGPIRVAGKAEPLETYLPAATTGA